MVQLSWWSESSLFNMCKSLWYIIKLIWPDQNENKFFIISKGKPVKPTPKDALKHKEQKVKLVLFLFLVYCVLWFFFFEAVSIEGLKFALLQTP